jgi:hypothetical protein
MTIVARRARRPAIEAAVASGPNANAHGDQDDAAGFTDLHIGGVDPKLGPVAFDRAVEKGPHFVVDLGPQQTDRDCHEGIVTGTSFYSLLLASERMSKPVIPIA